VEENLEIHDIFETRKNTIDMEEARKVANKRLNKVGSRSCKNS
jgi:hypothetical protein